MTKPKPRSSNHNSKPAKKPASSKTYLKYSNLALQIVLGLGIAGAIGYWLDQKLKLIFPIFLLTFILLTFIGIMYKLIKTLNEP